METRKHRFNIVDVIVILLVLAAAALIGIKLFAAEEEQNRVELTFVMQTLQADIDTMIPDELSPNVKEGDAVYDAESGRRIGTVVTCDSRPARYTGMSKSGNTVVSDVSGYKTLYITCTAQGYEDPDAYYSDGVMISTGKQYRLMLPDLVCDVECISVESGEIVE
ncbi:MAG: DUF4330 family protein [Clostridia bacterium]|nr:DUF4330 family protein [Clostridia bacterium]